jgi:hypothetical protein
MTPRDIGLEHQTHCALGVEDHGDPFRRRFLTQDSNHRVIQNLDARPSGI